MERGIILLDKDKHAIFRITQLIIRRKIVMRRKSRIIILFALVLLLLIPGMAAEAKTKPKLAAKKKTMTIGQTYH